MTLFWDAETASLSEAIIRERTRPFEQPPLPGPFDPTTVKCGNIGGPESEKGKAKIAAAKSEHEAATVKAEADAAKAETEYWQKKVEEAALSAATGRVVAIGCLSAENDRTLILGEDDPDEAAMLTKFWSLYRNMKAKRRAMVGVNILLFDLPFLVRRSWILDVPVPGTVRDGRYWDKTFVDLRDVWLLGQRWGECESSLDHMAKTLGIGSKTDGAAGECTGKTFAAMWESGNAQQRGAARAYLVNDLELPQRIAARMGIV